MIPMDGNGWHDPIFAQDHAYAESQIPPLRSFKFVSPGLLKTMGNSLVAGRDFTWTDVYEKRPVRWFPRTWRASCGRIPARAHRQTHPREPESARGAKSSAWSATSATTAWIRRRPRSSFWPILMDDFSGNKIVRATASGVHRSAAAAPGSSGFLNEVQPGRLVGESESAAGERSHARRRSTTNRWRAPRSRW